MNEGITFTYQDFNSAQLKVTATAFLRHDFSANIINANSRFGKSL